MQPQTLPTDPLLRFVRLYEALNRNRGFWGDASYFVLRPVFVTT